MSHSIYIIQIDTKRFKSVQQHQIVLLCKLYEAEFSILYVLMLYGYPLLDTLECVAQKWQIAI